MFTMLALIRRLVRLVGLAAVAEVPSGHDVEQHAHWDPDGHNWRRHEVE